MSPTVWPRNFRLEVRSGTGRRWLFALGIGLALVAWCAPLVGDITIETKSSISGIPFLSKFQMDQTQLIKGNRMAILTEAEIGVMDSNIATKSEIFMDADRKLLQFCDWEHSECTAVSLANVDSLLQSGMQALILGFLSAHVDSVRKYFTVEKADVKFTGNSSTISGYRCREVAYDMGGAVNVAMGQMGGSFKFKMHGNQWVTDDFQHYAEYRASCLRVQALFLTPQVNGLVSKILQMFGIDPALFTSFIDVSKFVNVQTGLNFTIEAWSPGMDVPSMTFTLRVDAVLVDISYDRIPDTAFELPSGFKRTQKSLSELFQDKKQPPGD